MNLSKYFVRLERLHHLIRKKATGSPAELAQRLNISERAVFEYIRTMREMGAPILFCTIRRTYYYEREVTLTMGFHELNEEEIKEVAGGSIDIIADYFTEFSRLH